MGGDNFMVIASDDAKKSVQDFIDKIKTRIKFYLIVVLEMVILLENL